MNKNGSHRLARFAALGAIVLGSGTAAAVPTSNNGGAPNYNVWWQDGSPPTCAAGDIAVQVMLAGGNDSTVAPRCSNTVVAKPPYSDTKHYACFSTAYRHQCPAPPPLKAYIPASYLVLSVLYAPPGSAAQGASKSSADYGSTTSTGTSTSASQSFKGDLKVTASASANYAGYSGTGSTSFGVGFSTTSSSEVDITKGSSLDIKVTGPNTDGIDHNQDIIYLWLNPRVNFAVSQTGDKNVAWSLTNNGSTMIVQYVYVAWLKNPSTMPAGVQAALAAAHIKPTDYATILARDPFANGGTTIDPNRFVQTNMTFPYEPQLSSGNAGPATTYSVNNSYATKASSSWTDSFTVGLSVEGGYNVEIVKASLKVEDSFTFSNTSTHGSTQENKQNASVTITGPSASYGGGTIVDVFYDTIYSTFMFAFDPASSPQQRDSSAGAHGKAAPGERVTLNVGGKTFQTYANAKGDYYFFNTPQGQGSVTARGVTTPIVVSPGKLPLPPRKL